MPTWIDAESGVESWKLCYVGSHGHVFLLDSGRFQLRTTDADLTRLIQQLTEASRPTPHGNIILRQVVEVDWPAQRYRTITIRFGSTQYALLRQLIEEHIESVRAGGATRYATNRVGLMDPNVVYSSER